MRLASAERMSSSALFTLATMWNRSRILRAWEHFSRITPKYGFHMSEQTNSIFAELRAYHGEEFLDLPR